MHQLVNKKTFDILYPVSLVPAIFHCIQNTFMKQVLLSVDYFFSGSLHFGQMLIY